MTNTQDPMPGREEVRAAFPPGHRMEGLSPLTHKQCLSLRFRLPAWLGSPDMPFLLGQVLEDLLDTHTGQPFEDENSDLVLTLLDLTSIESCAQTDYYRQSCESAFGSFSLRQCEAVYAWLLHVRDWPEVACLLEDPEDQEHAYAGALSYWGSRVKTA